MKFDWKDSAVDDGSQADFEELWVIEAKRRLDELRSGKVEGIDGIEAITTIREILARHVKSPLRED
jgi:hypothetical protein